MTETPMTQARFKVDAQVIDAILIALYIEFGIHIALPNPVLNKGSGRH